MPRKERLEEAAKLDAEIAAMESGEPETEEVTPPAESEPVATEVVAETVPEPKLPEVPPPAPEKKQGDYWEALKAQEARHRAEIAALEAKLIPAPKPEPEEQDEDLQAWNTAWRETAQREILPQIQAVQQQMFLTKLQASQQIAALTRSDYWELVNLADSNSELTKYLAENPDVARRIGQSDNIGVGLYNMALELKSRRPEYRQWWLDQERAKIRAELEAEMKTKLQDTVKKGAQPTAKPSSIASAPGSQAGSTADQLTASKLNNMTAEELDKLIDDMNSGKEIDWS